MFQWVKDKISGEAKTGYVAPPPVQDRLPQLYPPSDPGLPIRQASYLLEGNQQLLQRLKLHAAVSSQFSAKFHDPITRLAEHINSLPATASDLYSGEGGLLRACIELGFLSFQASDGRIFTGGATVEVRHRLEPRWRYVCFCAGLLYTIGAPMARLTVTNPKGETWPKHNASLATWALSKNIDRIYVNWAAQRGDSKEADIGPAPYTASLVTQIIGHENMDWIEQGSPELTNVLFQIVSGHDVSTQMAGQLIKTMWTKCKEREKSRMPQNFGRVSVGSNLTPYLVGAIQALITSGTWKANTKPLIVDTTGVYLIWPDAAADILQQASKEGISGIPSSPEVLAELLKGAGVFAIAAGNDYGLTQVVDADGEVLSAFRIQNTLSVMPDFDPADYAQAAPKTLGAVLAADPLTRAEGTAPAPSPVPQATPAPVATAKNEPAAVNKDSGDEGDDAESDDADAVSAQEPPKEVAPPVQQQRRSSAGEAMLASKGSIFNAKGESASDGTPSTGHPLAPASARPSASGSVKSGKPAAAGAGEKEVKDVKYSDLVAPEIRKDLKTALAVELLGKVIKAWRERGDDSTMMRMTDNGAAISYSFLSSIVRQPPDWLNEIAGAGLVYTPPSAPGQKIQKIAFPEGGATKQAVVISSYGCRKLGL